MSDAPTIETLKEFLAAFNAHDLDAIMEFFADDCEFCMPRGKEPWGTRYVGKAAVREGLATRFAGIPTSIIVTTATGSRTTTACRRGS